MYSEGEIRETLLTETLRPGMSDPNQILKAAQRILLADWSNPGVPRTLVEAGFAVFCVSPGRYSVVEILPGPPKDVDTKGAFPPQEHEDGYLVFRKLGGPPSGVDIVNVYRPENEHAGIVANQVVPLGAKVLWLQPSIASGTARGLAAEYGLELVEGIDIADVARDLGNRKASR
jgi:predicted CoA-binding protein